MKNIAILLIAVVFVLTGCALGSFSPEIGGETTVGQNYVTNLNEYDMDSGDALSVTDPSATVLSLAADQTITLTITNGIPDLDDAGTAIPGLAIYNLGAAEQTDGAYSRNSTVPYVLNAYQEGTAFICILTLNLSTGTYSNPLELHIDATTFSANGGIKFLDTNNNNTAGETSDDLIYYITVTGGTAPTTGAQRSPRATITSLGYLVDDNTTAQWDEAQTLLRDATVTDTAGTNKLTAANIASAITIEQWSGTAWTAVGLISPTYDPAANPRQFQASLPAALQLGQIYRQSRDSYALVESESVRGYIHRGSYNPQANITRQINVVGGNGEVRSFSSASLTTAQNAPAILRLAAPATVYINRTTVDLSRIMIRLTGKDKTYFGESILPDGVDNAIKIVLPESADIETGDAYTVYIAAGIMDDNDTDVASDDRMFFNVSDADDGTQTLSGNAI